jgi:CheY-like chemotaxis protein
MALALRYAMKKNILIADDDFVVRLMLVDALNRYAKENNVLTAMDGRHAVRAVESVTIDLVVTDLNMPEMDGYELISYLAENHPRIPVIVMTGDLTPQVEQRVNSAGISQCIRKPFDIKEVVTRILTELGNGHAHTGPFKEGTPSLQAGMR